MRESEFELLVLPSNPGDFKRLWRSEPGCFSTGAWNWDAHSSWLPDRINEALCMPSGSYQPCTAASGGPSCSTEELDQCHVHKVGLLVQLWYSGS